MVRKSLLIIALLGTAACSHEAGGYLDRGTFGNSNHHNTAVHSGDRSYVIELGRRFAREIPTTINFEFNSAQLDGAARATLDRQADWIKQFPEVRFKVFGHTDAVGSNAYNRNLGQRRANATVRYLVSKGISRKRLEAVVSFGETQPIIDTQDRERRNRRTVTEVSGFVGRPSQLDGKYAAIIYRDYVESAVVEGTLTLDGEITNSLGTGE